MYRHEDISVVFDNLGYGYNAVINGLSIFILRTQVSFQRSVTIAATSLHNRTGEPLNTTVIRYRNIKHCPTVHWCQVRPLFYQHQTY